MKFQGSLACLLLALCLGSGEAGPLQSGGESTGTNIGEALGQGTREAVGTGVRQVPGLGTADALGNRVGEAAHALGNPGHEIGRQVEDIIQHGADAVHGSWQGAPGHNGAWETSGGHGTFGSQGGLGGQGQGNPGGLGTPWNQGYPGNSAGSFGTNPQGAPWGQGGNGGPPNFGTNTQVKSPSRPCTNPPPSGSGGGSSNSGVSGEGQPGSSGSQSGSSGSGSNSDNNSSSSSGNSGGNGGGSSGNSGGNGGGSSGNSGSSNSNNGGSSNNNGGSRGDSGSESSRCENPGNEARGTGGSGIQDFRGEGVSSNTREVSKEGSHLLGGSGDNDQGQGSSWGSRGGDAVGGVNTVNSETSPGMFNFDTFWKNFKSKLGFINWDAISKDQRSSRIP
uniref:Dermokine n=1 Tax=Cercocebus atys TaxID=9531 RepID=A0A2K5MUE8_CERAT